MYLPTAVTLQSSEFRP